MQKLLFIDTNIFISCIFQEDEHLDREPLQKILKNLEDDKLILIMPEIIEKEIFNQLEMVADKLSETIKANFKSLLEKIGNNKGKISKLITSTIKEGQDNCLMKITDAKNEGLKIVQKIIKQKNTQKISMTDEIMLSGMRRSLFKIAPFNEDRNKSSHTKDQDCIAFESLLSFLKKEKYVDYTLITCTNDIDYQNKKEDKNLNTEIKKELQKMCKEIKSYKNPLKMLNEELDTKYTKKDIEKYVTAIPITNINTIFSAFYNNQASMINSCSVSGISGLTKQNFIPTQPISNMGISANSDYIIKDDQKKFCPYCGTNNLPNTTFCCNCCKIL